MLIIACVGEVEKGGAYVFKIYVEIMCVYVHISVNNVYILYACKQSLRRHFCIYICIYIYTHLCVGMYACMKMLSKTWLT